MTDVGGCQLWRNFRRKRSIWHIWQLLVVTASMVLLHYIRRFLNEICKYLYNKCLCCMNCVVLMSLYKDGICICWPGHKAKNTAGINLCPKTFNAMVRELLRWWLCTHCTHTSSITFWMLQPSSVYQLAWKRQKSCCNLSTALHAYLWQFWLGKLPFRSPRNSATSVAYYPVTRTLMLTGWQTLHTSLGWPRHTSEDKNRNLQSSRTHGFTLLI